MEPPNLPGAKSQGHDQVAGVLQRRSLKRSHKGSTGCEFQEKAAAILLAKGSVPVIRRGRLAGIFFPGRRPHCRRTRFSVWRDKPSRFGPESNQPACQFRRNRDQCPRGKYDSSFNDRSESLSGGRNSGGLAAAWQFWMHSCILCITSQRRRWITITALLKVVIATGKAGCGGHGSSSSSTTATTAGNYKFTITATNSGNAKITIHAIVTVTVQESIFDKCSVCKPRNPHSATYSHYNALLGQWLQRIHASRERFVA